MPSDNEILDSLEREEKKKTIKGILSVLFIVIVAMTVYYGLVTYKETKIVYGYPETIIDASSEHKANMLMVVKLENGNIIKASFPAGILFRKNKKLKLLQIETNFFGQKKYSVIEYLE